MGAINRLLRKIETDGDHTTGTGARYYLHMHRMYVQTDRNYEPQQQLVAVPVLGRVYLVYHLRTLLLCARAHSYEEQLGNNCVCIRHRKVGPFVSFFMLLC